PNRGSLERLARRAALRPPSGGARHASGGCGFPRSSILCRLALRRPRSAGHALEVRRHDPWVSMGDSDRRQAVPGSGATVISFVVFETVPASAAVFGLM